MEFLKNWILQVLYISILSIVLELLVPSSSLKKYAKVAIGFVIMITILNPLISFLKGGSNIEAYVFKNDYFLKNMNVDQISKEAEKQRNNLIVAEYKKRLIDQIKEKLLNLYEIDRVTIEVSLVENLEDKDFGKIKEMTILLEKSEKKKINYEEIKKTISAFYNVPLKNITIKEE
ncbi:MAG TPA: stage III sporulation protein AF [Clostridia bacterium]|nr:stage III sporulation protein AF [Clostridia bacterium]